MYDQISAILADILWIAGVVALYLFLFAPRDPKFGIVVARKFTPAHESSSFAMSYGLHGAMPPPMEPRDDWALQVMDESARTGWVHVSKEVYDEHPEYSYYRKH